MKLQLVSYLDAIHSTHCDCNRSEEAPASRPPVLVAVPGWETASVRDHDLDVTQEATDSIDICDRDALEQSEQKNIPATGIFIQEVQQVRSALNRKYLSIITRYSSTVKLY